jgi:hypothetical protein
LTPRLGVIAGDGLALAKALHGETAVGNAAHALHPLTHRCRAGTGQLQIVFVAAHGIGMPGDND